MAIVLLAAIQPFTDVLLANATDLVDPWNIISAAVMWLLLTVLGFVVVRLATRSRPPVPIAAGFVAFNLAFWRFGLFFPYEPISPLMRWVGLGVWVLLAALLVTLAVKLGALRHAALFLILLLGVSVLVSLAGFVAARGELSGGSEPTVFAGESPAFETTPNVYWFVLDEHARSDQFARLTGEDNSFFGTGLSELGFSVSESTRSAYAHTSLSIPSTLAMEYAFRPARDYRGEYQMAAALLRDSPVRQFFEDNGYRYVYAPDGSVEWTGCPDEARDIICIAPEGGVLALREPFTPLIRSTPLGSFNWPVVHNDPASVREGIDRLPDDEPLFVFAHIMSPHQPHRYRADCSERRQWIDGQNLTGEERAAAYATDVGCLDHDLLRTLAEVIANDPDAVIIVQSDHGSKLGFSWDDTTFESASPSMLEERFGAVNAIRLPGDCRGRSIEGEPLVNTFRLVTACLAEEEPDLLPTRSFFNEFGGLDTLTEIPEERFQGP